DPVREELRSLAPRGVRIVRTLTGDTTSGGSVGEALGTLAATFPAGRALTAGARLVTRGATRGVVASRGTEAARRALEGVSRARRSPSLPKAPARKGSTAQREVRLQRAERRATTAQKVGAYVAARSATRRGL